MQTIPLINLSYALLPLIIVGYFYYKYTGNKSEIIYSSFRMIFQLLLLGYCLLYIFSNNNSSIAFIILFFMLVISTFITIRNIQNKSPNHFYIIFISIASSSLLNLALILYLVLEVYIYKANIIIPIAGMIIASTMNCMSLSIERFEKDKKNSSFEESRQNAFKAALIPQINSFLAVGLVSLPGMMTGQILSGIDPLIAVRYQIMIMLVVLSAAGLSNIIYFTLMEKFYKNHNN